MNSLLAKLSPTATNMIRLDHTHVMATFHQFEADTPAPVKRALVNTICLALEIHAAIEEEIFYPAMRAVPGDEGAVAKSYPEHAEMKRLIAALRGMEPTDADFDRTFMELMRDVLHHVADEETGLLNDAERLIPDQLAELGARMTKRRLELAAPRAGEIAANTFGAIPLKSMLVGLGLAAAAGGYALKRSRKVGS